MKRLLIAVMLAGLLGGCAINIKVNPVTPGRITTLCILHNPDILANDFEPMIQEMIADRGIQTILAESPLPQDCRHRMEYTANWRWDIVMYLVYAEFRVYEDIDQIGLAQYSARSGGARLDKFGTAKGKVEPLMDRLFGKPVHASTKGP